MRSLTTLAAVLLAVNVAAARDWSDADRAEYRAKAEEFVGQVARGAWAEAERSLAATGGIAPDELRRRWDGAVNRLGAFQRVVQTSLELRGSGQYATVGCQFASGRLDARVAFNAERRPTSLTLVPPPLGGPGLVRCRAVAAVKPARPGEKGTVTFPIPGTYREQVPLAFAIHADPPGAASAFRWVRRDDGLNWLCEVTVAAPAEGAIVGWEALVLVGDRPPAALPPAAKPEVPADAKLWLRSTACVESDDPAVRAKADELARGTDDVSEYVRRAMRFASQNPLRDLHQFYNLGARVALTCGGSCTSRANLGAALLRARGIPARTVAHLPTWCGPLYEHWLVEYWHPGAGWVWYESSLDEAQPRPWTLVVLNVARPEDEDRSFDKVQTRFVARGAPYLAVHLCSANLNRCGDARDMLPNSATAALPLLMSQTEWQGLVAAAAAAHAALAREAEAGRADTGRAERLLNAARVGGVAGLTKALGS